MNIIKYFLNSKKQRVVLNSQFSLSAVLIQEYLSQRSILGPSFFLIYISYLSVGWSSNPKLVADNTFLLIIIPNINLPITCNVHTKVSRDSVFCFSNTDTSRWQNVKSSNLQKVLNQRMFSNTPVLSVVRYHLATTHITGVSRYLLCMFGKLLLLTTKMQYLGLEGQNHTTDWVFHSFHTKGTFLEIRFCFIRKFQSLSLLFKRINIEFEATPTH